MTKSILAPRTVLTANQSDRNGVKPSHIVLHHMATTNFEAVLESWASGVKQGSCHYAISNSGEAVSVVPEEARAWSLSNAIFDGKSLIFEIANESVGGSWPVSLKAHEATARVVADLCQRYNIPSDRTKILGHREVYTRHGAGYATACPGGLDIDGIVSRVIEINKLGIGAPSKPVNVTVKPVWEFNPPSKRLQKRIQWALFKRGRYAGPIDGVWGSNTIKGIQLTVKNVGYTGPIDGVEGVSTSKFVQVYANRFGGYDGPIDSILGSNSWTGFAIGLETP